MSDLDDTFAGASDGCSLPSHTISHPRTYRVKFYDYFDPSLINDKCVLLKSTASYKAVVISDWLTI